MKNINTDINNKEQFLDNISTGKYYDYLYFFAVQKIDDTDLVKALIQETFLTALQSRPKFESKSSELTWLTAILKYKIYRVYRKRTSNKIMFNDNSALELISDSVSYNNVNDQNKKWDEIVNSEFSAAIRSFVETPPVKWQQLYDLKYVQSEETNSILEKLKLSPENYWVMSHRLKSTLKHWYIKTWAVVQ